MPNAAIQIITQQIAKAVSALPEADQQQFVTAVQKASRIARARALDNAGKAKDAAEGAKKMSEAEIIKICREVRQERYGHEKASCLM